MNRYRIPLLVAALLLGGVLCVAIVLAGSRLWRAIPATRPTPLPSATPTQTSLPGAAITATPPGGDIYLPITAADGAPATHAWAYPPPPTLSATPTATSPTTTSTPTPTTTTSPTPTLSPTATVWRTGNGWVETTLVSMTIEQKIGQLIFTGVVDDQVNDADCEHVRTVHPGGITFHPENVFSPDQMREFSAQLAACTARTQPVEPFLAVTYEGEYVNPFNTKVTTFPAALALGATDESIFAYQASYAAGLELRYSGLNMVLAPIADVLLNDDNIVVSQRTYGGNPSMVSSFVDQSVSGYGNAGLIPVLKHFPGYGGVAEDSREEMPIDPVEMAELERNYLPSFIQGLRAGAPVVMLSHVVYPNLTGDQMPANHSPWMTTYLRNELRFDGIILSDEMQARAVAGEHLDIPDSALLAVQSGVDMLILDRPDQARATYTRLMEAFQEGDLSLARIDNAVRHILLVKHRWGLAQGALPLVPEPDWNAHQRLAIETGYRAVTLYRDDQDWIPLPNQVKKVLVIGPDETWDFYLSKLRPTLEAAGKQVDFVFYSPPWNGPIADRDCLESMPEMTRGYDLVLVFTWQAHINHILWDDDWQAELVDCLQDRSIPMIVVGLKSPTDLLEFPTISTYLSTFGTNSGAMQGLLDILVGKRPPLGRNPLPNLP